ncbi:MAG: hypothetical protein CMP23_10460 [Rickettsiales bacterium]|nr:hypothetical protein [Rickettsiales bacterium]
MKSVRGLDSMFAGAAVAALLALLVSFSSCGGGGQSCEEDMDCLIVCQCPGVEATVSVGPYPCRFGSCGQQHAEDLDCVRPCVGAIPPAVGDDDDSGSPAAGADDDDSSQAR